MPCYNMKTVSMKMLGSLLVMCCLVLMTACGTVTPETPVETPTDPDVPETPELPEISPDSIWVNFKSELEFGEEPLVKSGSSRDDLYLLVIKQIIPSNDYSGNPYTDYYGYAWGYFDDLSLAVFKLSKLSKYSFALAYIPNGKNLIHEYGNGIYGHPFYPQYNDAEPIPVNTIQYGSHNPSSIADGVAQPKGSTDTNFTKYYWNNIVRYQGVVENFDPSKSNVVNIKLYRMMIGFKITIEDFTEGSVEIRDLNGIKYTLKPTSSGTSVLDIEIETPMMPSIGSTLNGMGLNLDNFTEEELDSWIMEKINYGFCQVHISYYDNEGDELKLYTHYQFQYKRNTKYTLSFSLSDAISNGGISPEIVEDSEMEESSLLQ